MSRMQPVNLRVMLFKLVKIFVGFALLFLAFYHINWNLFTDAIQNVNFGWLLLAFLSVVAGLAIKVGRWYVLLHNYGIKLPLYRLISAYFIGQAANIVLFFRGGEVLRIGWMHTQGKDDLIEITATIAFEKYLDLVMLVGAMMIVAPNLPEAAAERFGNLSPWLAGISFLLFAIIMFGPWLWKRITSGIIFSGWPGKIQNKINQFINASLWLRRPERLLPVFGISIVIWLTMALTNILLFLALDIQPGWQASGLVLVLVYIGVLPALMPGNIGPFTYFAQLGLIPFEIGTAIALAFAILLYGIVTIPPLIIAGIMLLIPGNREINTT